MSVINQMLRDLDSRQASEQERAGLPPRLRSLPGMGALANNARGWRMLVFGMIFGVLLTGLAAWLLAPLAIPLVLRGAVPASLSVTPPATLPVTLPDAAPTPPVVVSAPTVTQQAAEETLHLPIDQADIKLSPSLSQDKSNAVSPPVADEILAVKKSQEAKEPLIKPQGEVKATPKTAPKPDTKPVEVLPPPAMLAITPAPHQAMPKPKSPPASVPISAATAKSSALSHVAETQINKRVKGEQVHEMAEVEYRKGMQAIKRGENSAALPALQRAIELEPGFAKARQALLSVLVGARQWTEAQQVAQNGLALDPAQSGWAMIVARLQFEQNNAPAAIETLEGYAAHAASDADYHGFFAYLLQKQQRPGEAAQHFQIAVGLRPSEGRWWFGLGLSREANGHLKEAQQAYAKALEVGNLPADMAAVVAEKLR